MALTGAGIEAAQLEARELICAAAGKTAEELYRDISLYTTDEIAVQTEALLARRLAGEPIAYLIGEWSFCGLPFYVSPEVLIPRVDTEMLAQLAMNRLKENPGHTRILDLCAGTGCLGITAAALVKPPGRCWWTCRTGPWSCVSGTSAATASPAGWST